MAEKQRREEFARQEKEAQEKAVAEKERLAAEEKQTVERERQRDAEKSKRESMGIDLNVSGRLLDSSRVAPEAPAAPAEVKESEEAPKAQPVGEPEEEGVVKEAGEDEIVVAASPIDMMDMDQPDDRDDSQGRQGIKCSFSVQITKWYFSSGNVLHGEMP